MSGAAQIGGNTVVVPKQRESLSGSSNPNAWGVGCLYNVLGVNLIRVGKGQNKSLSTDRVRRLYSTGHARTSSSSDEFVCWEVAQEKNRPTAAAAVLSVRIEKADFAIAVVSLEYRDVVQGKASAVSWWRADRLVSLQAKLGFATHDFAAVLGVSNSELYDLLDKTNDVGLQDVVERRVKTLDHIASEWHRLSGVPLGSVVYEQLATGDRVLDLLSANELNQSSVLAVFDELQRRLQAKPKTPSQRLLEAGFTRRKSARSLSSDE